MFSFLRHNDRYTLLGYLSGFQGGVHALAISFNGAILATDGSTQATSVPWHRTDLVRRFPNSEVMGCVDTQVIPYTASRPHAEGPSHMSAMGSVSAIASNDTMHGDSVGVYDNLAIRPR